MNKKLLALAVGAAISAAPMFASAGVKVYGHAQVEVGTRDAGAGNNTFTSDNARGRWGVKASEKLGNGMTALAKFEFRVDTSDNRRGPSGQTSTPRESMVGLKGGFGTIELGNLKSAYKYHGGVKYDPFVATMLEARGAGGMTGGQFGHNAFMDNAIGYKTPKMGAVSGWATVSVDETADERGATDGDYSFGLKFKQKAFEVFVAGINDDSANYDSIKIGGQYKFGNFKISGQYEMGDVAGVDLDTYFIGGQAKFGANVLVAQFGNTEATGVDVDYFSIGVIHNMSKKTRLTAGFANTDVGAGDVDTFAVGMRVKF